MRAGASHSARASASARPGSPGSSARSASGAVGWTWIVAGATPPEDRARGIGSARMVDKEEKSPAGRAEAVRSAAVQAFQTTAGQAGITRERAQDLADELVGAAGAVLGALDELRPATADDMRAVREQLRALEARVTALEAAAARPAARSKPKPKAT